jgi:hypothetical protein
MGRVLRQEKGGPLFLLPVFHGERVSAQLTGEGLFGHSKAPHPPFGHLLPVKNGEKEKENSIKQIGNRFFVRRAADGFADKFAHR